MPYGYYGYYYDSSYILVIIAALLTMMASGHVKSTYNKYARIKNSRGYTGEMIARDLSSRYGLNIRVEQVAGELSDHFDPRSMVIRLSTIVHSNASIASVAVAAHECGHAMQHKENYGFLTVRNSLVPIVNVSNNLGWVAIMIGLFSGWYQLCYIGFILLMLMLLFQVVTLPVEFDASRRGLQMLEECHYLSYDELPYAKKVLKAAALTYIAGVASTILNLIRTLTIISGRDRRR